MAPGQPTGDERTGGAPADWAAGAADSIDRLVGAVRSRSLAVERLTRVIVFGVVVLLLGLVALVLGTIAAVRGLDELVPGEVWPAHLLVGGIFLVAGLFIWRKRSAPAV